MRFHQFSLVLVLLMIIFLKPNCGGADVLQVKSNTTYQCDGLLNECRIGEGLESQLDFLMDYAVIRILQAANKAKLSSNSLNAKKPVQTNCKVYTNCIAKGGNAECKNIFACRKQLGHK
ncbi:hypothetical protein REPUB_Repub12eG0020100 [Reevesia pubescens]